MARKLIDPAVLKQRFWERQYYPTEAICEKIDNTPEAELTDEAAIEHLQASGWMQRHDYEMSRPGWIPFKWREPDAEEKENHPDWTFVFDCPLPDDKQEILVSNGRWVWKDEWSDDAGDCGLESGDDIDEGMAWMPMPEPYRRDEE